MLSYPQHARAERAAVTDDSLTVDIADGRTVSVPLGWFPRLVHATAKERKLYRLIGGGEGLHWPDLDEDISVENLILGRPSGESQASLKKWLEARTARPGRKNGSSTKAVGKTTSRPSKRG